MGRSHAISALAISGAGSLCMHLPPGQAVAAGVGLLAGVMLPDLDHPRSHASAALGPWWARLSRYTRHRGPLHSLTFAVLVSALTLTPWPILASIPLGVGLAGALRALGGGQGLQTIGMLAALGGGLMGIIPWITTACVGAGMVVHVMGDAITRNKVDFWWPLADGGFGGGGFRAGGKIEKWAVVPLMSGLAVMGWAGVLLTMGT